MISLITSSTTDPRLFKFLHSIMFYITVIAMEINMGCIIEFLSARMILAVGIKRKF